MSIWRSGLTVEQLNRPSIGGSMAWHLGVRFTEVGPDYLRATMPVNEYTRQPAGILHGGANVTLAETVGSVASAMLAGHEQWRHVGLEVNANHLRRVADGTVTATARPLHIGRSTQVWDVRIEDEAGRITCICRLTVMTVGQRAEPDLRLFSPPLEERSHEHQSWRQDSFRDPDTDDRRGPQADFHR
ncbi:MAG: hotdog fold thioesterase [Immundisolibacter sp.]